MIRRPPRSTLSSSSAASDVYKRQVHEERIIHSDLKPANFLCVQGMLKLIDFGIAKTIQSDATSVVCEKQMGTLNYMSPEAINTNNAAHGASKIGRASDVWSLGCILYEMTVGEPPFAKIKNLVQKIQAITNPCVDITYPEGINPDLKAALVNCLNRDPKLRPSIPELLEDPFLHPNKRLAQTQQACNPTGQQPLQHNPDQMNSTQIQAKVLQAILPVMQQLAAAQIQVDGAQMEGLSKEIGEQLTKDGTVDISKLSIMANRSTKTCEQKPLAVDKENCPPQGHPGNLANNSRLVPGDGLTLRTR
eukprot:TRINITY_DN28272_c0_g2_i1.p1 TRINITY_DN28272_c0_g2~~TRINITY_DN28272_c0_g2_i1.p1  ORF type:complete len:305 (+),score=58.97 TRINITY_DN28272_c0_g2_i1:52-966(+)